VAEGNHQWKGPCVVDFWNGTICGFSVQCKFIGVPLACGTLFNLLHYQQATNNITNVIVSTSDVIPTDHWLNIWCMVHKIGNASGFLKSFSDWLNSPGWYTRVVKGLGWTEASTWIWESGEILYGGMNGLWSLVRCSPNSLAL